MKETASPNVPTPASNSTDIVEMEIDTHDHTMDTDRIGDQANDNNDYDEGKENLNLIVKVMKEQEEQDQRKQDVRTNTRKFFYWRRQNGISTQIFDTI